MAYGISEDQAELILRAPSQYLHSDREAAKQILRKKAVREALSQTEKRRSAINKYATAAPKASVANRKQATGSGVV